MISHIKGIIEEIGPDYVVFESGGMGFKIFMPSRDISEAGRLGEEARVFTEMIVREDFIGLYGFVSQYGRQVFNLLCTVNGIGPKTAMAVLSSSAPEKVAFAIAAGDTKSLIAPGVGKKLAERIALELKGKLLPSADYAGEEASALETSSQVEGDDAIRALISLGYTRSEAENAVRRALKENSAADAGTIIRKALGTFAAKG